MLDAYKAIAKYESTHHEELGHGWHIHVPEASTRKTMIETKMNSEHNIFEVSRIIVMSISGFVRCEEEGGIGDDRRKKLDSFVEGTKNTYSLQYYTTTQYCRAQVLITSTGAVVY